MKKHDLFIGLSLKKQNRKLDTLLKRAILTREERMEIASRIATGHLLDENNEPPKVSDRLKALDYLSRLEGDYAAQNIKVSTPLPIMTIRIDPDEVERMRLNR